MHPDPTGGHLQRARTGIQQALAQWDPTDLERVDDSRELLVAAVREMRLFESAVIAGGVLPTAELRATILAAQAEIVQATRVVDACVAFHRGLIARTAGAPPVYDADGHITGDSESFEPEVHA